MYLFEIVPFIISVLFVIWFILFLTVKLYRWRLVNKIYNEIVVSETILVYGWVPNLKVMDELIIWYCPEHLKKLYPEASTETIQALMGRLSKTIFTDVLFVKCVLSVVIRAPKHCFVSFGSGPMNYQNNLSSIKPAIGMGSHELEQCDMSRDAKLVCVVKHFI